MKKMCLKTFTECGQSQLNTNKTLYSRAESSVMLYIRLLRALEG